MFSRLALQSGLYVVILPSQPASAGTAKGQEFPDVPIRLRVSGPTTTTTTTRSSSLLRIHLGRLPLYLEQHPAHLDTLIAQPVMLLSRRSRVCAYPLDMILRPPTPDIFMGGDIISCLYAWFQRVSSGCLHSIIASFSLDPVPFSLSPSLVHSLDPQRSFHFFSLSLSLSFLISPLVPCYGPRYHRAA